MGAVLEFGHHGDLERGDRLQQLQPEVDLRNGHTGDVFSLEGNGGVGWCGTAWPDPPLGSTPR